MTEAYLVTGVRTPIGRYAGALATVRPDDMAAHVIRALADRLPSVDWSALDDVLLGCANQAGEDNRNVARMAALLADLPIEAPGSTINRLCGSGLDAVGMAARAIRAGDADLIIAGGVESMSRAPFVLPKPETAYSRRAEIADTTIGWRFVNPKMQERFGTDAMPQTAENVARDFNVSREDQDAFALRSQERAAKAIAAGRMAREIAPIPVPQRKGPALLVDRDEHPRDTSLEALANSGRCSRAARSPPATPPVSTTARPHCSSPPKRPSRTTISPRWPASPGWSSVGVPPRIMGIGPEPATRRLLGRAGLEVSDIDLFELNEAFASQSLAVLRGLGLAVDSEIVNPNGGAIAFGHPLGMSGARLALSAAIDLADRTDQGARRAVATMCIGVGMGIALLLESV